MRALAVRSVAVGCACAALALCCMLAPAAATAQPTLAAAMIEASTGQRLYGLRRTQELAIASTTKLMTALVTLEEHVRLSAVFTDPAYYPAPDDSQIGLVPGERMTVHDLLIAMMLPSADDAAEDIAWGVGHGQVGRFVAIMNARARQLGLTHTHYSTPIGLDTPGNYSSASDLVTLARFLLRTEPFIRSVVAMPRAVIRMGGNYRVVTNLNDLVGRVPWVNGVKTGHTTDAGYVLVGSGTRNGMTLISAVLGAPSEAARDSDTYTLLSYGFNHFRLRTPIRAGAVLARPPVQGYPAQRAQLIATSSFSHVFPRSTRIRVVIRAPKELTGPLRARAVLGAVIVLAGGARVATIPLALARAVPAPPKPLLSGVGPGGFRLLALVLLIVAFGVVGMLRREWLRALSAAHRRPA